MFLAEQLLLADRALPPMLSPILMRLAGDCHPAVRVGIISKLAYMQSKIELGWQLFEAAFSDDDQRVWAHGEGSLYYATGKMLPRAKPFLDRMETSEVNDVREAWGRLSALSVLGGQMSRKDLIEKLVTGGDASAWKGAISVWVANAGNVEHSLYCFEALEQSADHAIARLPLLRLLEPLFESKHPIVKVPLSLFRAAYCDGVCGSQVSGNLAFQLDEWLCQLAEIDPDETLEFAEVIASICKNCGESPFYDPAPLGMLLTLLFREAEEREDADSGKMLRRVVVLQDVFLSMPTSRLGEWLRDAERPDA